MWEKVKKIWWFYLKNPVIRKGESGGFKWRFRRFWLDIASLSGNFKMRFTADEYPYGYLLSGNDENVQGFSERLYYVGKVLTTDSEFVRDLDAALKALEDRAAAVELEQDGEEMAIEEVKETMRVAQKLKEN